MPCPASHSKMHPNNISFQIIKQLRAKTLSNQQCKMTKIYPHKKHKKIPHSLAKSPLHSLSTKHYECKLGANFNKPRCQTHFQQSRKNPTPKTIS